jgi:hypothetical protein
MIVVYYSIFRNDLTTLKLKIHIIYQHDFMVFNYISILIRLAVFNLMVNIL